MKFRKMNINKIATLALIKFMFIFFAFPLNAQEAEYVNIHVLIVDDNHNPIYIEGENGTCIPKPIDTLAAGDNIRIYETSIAESAKWRDDRNRSPPPDPASWTGARAHRGLAGVGRHRAHAGGIRREIAFGQGALTARPGAPGLG